MHTENCECEKIEELLYDYADGNLDDACSDAVREHLMHCGDCASLYEEIAKTKEYLSASYEKAPASLLPNVMEAVGRYEQKKKRASVGLWFTRYGAFAAAMLIVVALSVAAMPIIKGVLNSATEDSYGGIGGGQYNGKEEVEHSKNNAPGAIGGNYDGTPDGSEDDGDTLKDSSSQTTVPDGTDSDVQGGSNGELESPPEDSSPVPDGSIACVFKTSVEDYTRFKEREEFVYFGSRESILVLVYSEGILTLCNEYARSAEPDSVKDKVELADAIIKQTPDYQKNRYILIVLE